MTQNPKLYDSFPPQGEKDELVTIEVDPLHLVANSVVKLETDTEEPDPFAAFGSLSDTQIEGNPHWVEPQPIAAEVKPAAVPFDERTGSKTRAEAKEKKLQMEKAELGVHLNREAIANILNDNPHLLRAADKGLDLAFDGAATEELNERRADLQATLDAIANLPEQISFDEGLTLIVGDNGLGKSTLAQAIRLVARLRHNYDTYGPGKGEPLPFEDYLAENLTTSKVEDEFGNNQETLPSILSILIARNIKLESFASAARPMYLDATTLNGHRHSWGITSGRPKIDEDLSSGYSHGQLIKWGLFGHLKDRKESATAEDGRTEKDVVFLDEIENGLSPRNHRKLKADLEESLTDGSVAVVATNSDVLYFDPDIPRIDLEHSELGVHKPSDHPDIYDLDEFK